MASPKPVYVLDACALLRLAQAEPGMGIINLSPFCFLVGK